MQAGPHFAMVAGEASGDLLAGLLLDGFRQKWPALVVGGIGGTQMQKRNFEAWWPSDKLAVRGYVEVLRHYREIVGIRKALQTRLLNDPPSLFVGVDAPDFNLELEYQLKSRGIKTVHYICPSIWAWRADRVEKIRRSVDHVLCLFPFEPQLLAQHGIEATFVGHPLAQVIPMRPDRPGACKALGLDPDAQVLALLPGSRASEIKYLAPRFFAAARLLAARQPKLQIVLPAVPALQEPIKQMAMAAGVASVVQILQGQSHQALEACDVTLIASGTATLEAALYKRPMVIAYNMNALSWQIMRRKKLQPWVGLPNILCADFVVPELLQDQATPQALAAAVQAWLDQPEKGQALNQRFSALHAGLQRDTASLATHAVEKVLAS